MTVNNTIPTLWMAALLDNLDDAHIYANCLNRDYEGDIRNQGDRVRINSIGRPTIRSYTKNTTITAPEVLNDSQQSLIIDQADYFNFFVDDVDKVQSNAPVMDEGMRNAAWGLADTTDAYLAALLAAGVDTGNQLTALTSVGDGVVDDDAYTALVDLDTKLSENNVPRDGNRWVVVPPWFEGQLRLDARFVSFGTDKNRENLRGALVGTASGFNVWTSNNVPVSASAYTLVAGYKGAATFAEQIDPDNFELYRPHDQFADACKGLHIYGATVTRPYALASVVVTEAT